MPFRVSRLEARNRWVRIHNQAAIGSWYRYVASRSWRHHGSDRVFARFSQADEVPDRLMCGNKRLAARQEIYAKLLRFGFLERFIHQSATVIGFAVRVTTVLQEILAVRTHPKMMLALLLRDLVQHAL